MKSEYAQNQLRRMKIQILDYQNSRIVIGRLANNLLALFEAIEESEREPKFVESFHEIWDQIEVAIALGKANESESLFKQELLPKLLERIEEYIIET